MPVGPNVERSIREAVSDYANYRNDVHWRGADVRTDPDVARTRDALISLTGAGSLQDFDFDRWRAASGESERSPHIDVEAGVQYVMNRREEILVQRGQQDLRDDIAGTREKTTGGLEPGTYRYEDGEFVRVGDAGILRRYHGTLVDSDDEIIDRFVPSPGHQGSENRPSIGVTPAVYTTSDPVAAVNYGRGYNWSPGQGEFGQFYVVDIHADTVADLRNCQDDAVARKAIEMGFDVIECPDFWEQPETIAFDPDRIEIKTVYSIVDDAEEFYDDDGEPIDDEDLIEELRAERYFYERGSASDRNVDRIGELGMLSGPIRREGESVRPPSRLPQHGRRDLVPIAEALEDYQSSNSAVRMIAEAGLTQSMEYRGMPKQPTYSPRGGRGSMRY